MSPQAELGRHGSAPYYENPYFMGFEPAWFSWADRQTRCFLNGPLCPGRYSFEQRGHPPLTRARQKLGVLLRENKPAFFMNGWGQGEPQKFLGRCRTLDAATMRRIGVTSGPPSTEPAWLFGRKTRTQN